MSLNGKWIFNGPTPSFSSLGLGHEDLLSLYGHRFISTSLHIRQISRSKEEIYLTYISSSEEHTFHPISIEELNIISLGNASGFISTVALSSSFDSFSLLIIGPKGSYRLLEEYTLLKNGSECQVSYLLSTLDVPSLLITRSFIRQPNSEMLLGINFVSCNIIRNWRLAKAHHGTTLRTTRIIVTIADTILSQEEKEHVIKYRVKVHYEDKAWAVNYRFRDFHAVYAFIMDDITAFFPDYKDQIDLPAFPPRKIGKLSASALETRRAGLQNFFSSLLAFGGLDCTNTVDVLSAFFEIPRYWSVEGNGTTILSPPSLTSYDPIVGAPPIASILLDNRPFYVTVKSARISKHGLFPCLSLVEWVPHVEYEICLTMGETTLSIYKRYRDIATWLYEVQTLLRSSYAEEVLHSKLNFPAYQTIHPQSAPSARGYLDPPVSSPDKLDLNGPFVRLRVLELEEAIQTLLTTFAEVIDMPTTINFLELNEFARLSGVTSNAGSDSFDEQDLS